MSKSKSKNWDRDARIKELFIQNWMRKFKNLYTETKNPLYVWEAILFSSAYKLPLPEWCLDYLSIAALEIKKLIVQASTWATSGKCLEPFEASLTPGQAADAIPRALGIIRSKVNAFERLSADRETLEDYNAMWIAEIVQEAGATLPPDWEGPPLRTAAEVEEGLRTKRNLDNIRSVKARVRKGRRLHARSEGSVNTPK